MRSRIAFLAFALTAGCQSEVAPTPSDPICDVNPERLTPQIRSQQGTEINGTALNRATLNGTQMNGAVLQGITLNGRYLNGREANGRESNGREGNGRENNGREGNGRETNGRDGNGKYVNGVEINGGALLGTELVTRVSEQSVLRGADLVGAILTGITTNGDDVPLTIAAVEKDADDPEIVFYRLDQAGQNICGEGGKGIFVDGIWDATGARVDSVRAKAHELKVTYSCTTGVIAKCVRWGYKPWATGVDLHHTCTRMARADYCGNGVPYTKNGTEIDLYDTRGIQSPTGEQAFLFEAGWGRQGAVCAARTRYEATNASGAEVLPSCWAALPKCDSWESAQSQGAVLGNSSRIASRTFCE